MSNHNSVIEVPSDVRVPVLGVPVPEGVPVQLPGQPGGLVYVLHFPQPVAHSAHYIGVTGETTPPTLATLVEQPGRARNLFKALSRRGGGFVVADEFETPTLAEAYALERKLKQQGSRARLCSICNPGNGRGLGRGKNRNGCRKRPAD